MHRRTLMWFVKPVAYALSFSLLAGAVQGLPPLAVAAAAEPGVVDRSVPVQEFRSTAADMPEMPDYVAKPVVWPSTGSATAQLALSPDRSRRLPNTVAPGGLPVTVTALPSVLGDVVSGRAHDELADASTQPGRIGLTVLDREASQPAGVPLVLKASRMDGGFGGRASVRVDYSAFADAYGGDWSWRLRLVALPACALTTPLLEACGQVRPLGSINDGVAQTLSAELDFADGESVAVDEPMFGAQSSAGSEPASEAELLIGVMAAASSTEAADFSKTDLKPSSSWSAGGSSGDFNWSYPIAVPPVPGGLVPQVALSYSSGAVDGQTSGGNTQPGHYGEGWSYSPGFIERTYRTCSDDSSNSPYWTALNGTNDLCWRLPNAQFSLNGKSSEIILGSDGKWRLADDDGEKVELLTGVSNGDTDGEHWKVTTTDGTQYWFGRQTMPNGKGNTNSAPVVPVFANHSGEPCFSSSSASASRCQQAWRWNLDYVVDRNGNEISYWYTRETVRTGLMGSASSTTTYHRSAHLYKIEYGTHYTDSSAVVAPARVVFANTDRCFTASCGTHDGTNHPDTPWDLECLAAPCTTNVSPSFWLSTRVSKISTEVLVGGSHSTVDEWNIGGQFPATGTGLKPVLWLSAITRTGKTAGGSATLPSLVTYGTKLQNRADYDPNASMASHMKYRINRLVTESGGQVDVTYAADDPACVPGVSDSVQPHQNSKRCFPQYYTNPSGNSGWSWWHKRIVSNVTESDLVGGSPAVSTDYTYSTASSTSSVLWGHSDGASIWGSSLNFRSWGDWRGYSDVTVKKGPTAGLRSQTDLLYFRGLNGDLIDTGTLATRVVTINTYDGSAATDSEDRRGHLINERIYDQAGGSPVQLLKHDPWTVITGTRTLLQSWAVPTWQRSYTTKTKKEIRWEWVGGAWSQRASTDATFDATVGPTVGRITAMQDNGSDALANDETCTRYTYADNPTGYKYAFMSQQQTAEGTCAVTPQIPGDLISDQRFYYDGWGFGGAPGRGNVTKTDAYGDTGWIITGQNIVYDQHGQVTSADDALGRRTLTAYTENPQRLTTSVTVTNPALHTTTVAYDTMRGLPLTVTDANSKVSTGVYDPLGRLTKVTKPGNSTGIPDVEYSYNVSASTPTWVSTKVLGPNNNQVASYEIYDGLLRLRQTQSTATDGKRAITDTVYDQRGLPVKNSVFYNAASGPTSTLVTFGDLDIDQQTRHTYDGRGRQLTAELWKQNVFQWKTSTVYAWDGTSVIPPAGGTTTQDIVNDLGQVVEKRQFHIAGDLGSTFDKTTYGYDPAHRLTTVTDPGNNTWTYGYDLLGRRVGTIDPDAGTSSSTYDNAGQTTSSTDSRGQKLFYEYDSLGRKTVQRADTAGGTILASWTYDTVAKGQLTSTSRIDGAATYTSAVNSYDNGYRPLSTTDTVPGFGSGGSTLNYTVTNTYKTNGALATTSLPAVGGLPAETITQSYIDIGPAHTLISTAGGGTTYVADTRFNYEGRPTEQYFGAPGKQVLHTTHFDRATDRLVGSFIRAENQSTPGTFDLKYSDEYTYDPAGNILSAAGNTNGTADQQECFGYDHLARLTTAWTQTSGTCTTPQRTGADPYWRSWTFDSIGNRLTQTDNPSAGATIWNYHNGVANGVKPHQLKQVTATGPLAGPARTFSYDNAGNMLTGTSATGAAQTLTWDKEGHLATFTEAGTTTSYTYDTGGRRLIAANPNKKTLYLPDGTELEKIGAADPLGQRYYAGVAVRDATGLKWTIANHQGSNTVQIDSITLVPARRRLMPYGEARSTQPVGWLGTKGYVGGTADPTGLTHLGAREYDPTLGRFISVDPIMDLADPQQWNAYTYSHNSPISYADPDGLRDEEVAAGRMGAMEAIGYSNHARANSYKERAKARKALDLKWRAEIASRKDRLRMALIKQDQADEPVPHEYTPAEKEKIVNCLAGGHSNCTVLPVDAGTAGGGDKLSDIEINELEKKARGEPYDPKIVKKAEKKVKNQQKYAGTRNVQKRQSHYGAQSEAIEVGLEDALVTVGGVVVVVGVIVGCVLLCWLNPAMA